MILDRLVVGLRDLKLSEKLQVDADLTREKAVNASRQSETVKKQQDVVRPKQNIDNKHISVNAVYKKHYKPKKPESKSKFLKKKNEKYNYKRGQLVIPTGRYSDRSIFRQVYIPTGLSFDRSIFRQVYIPTGLYSDRSIFRQVVIPTALYSDRSLFRQVYIPTGLYSDRSIFRQVVIPTVP